MIIPFSGLAARCAPADRWWSSCLDLNPRPSAGTPVRHHAAQQVRQTPLFRFGNTLETVKHSSVKGDAHLMAPAFSRFDSHGKTSKFM
jgi:hypothetical protein